MDFEKFCEEIKQRLTDTIPDDYGIIIRKVSKNNGVSFKGISIHAKHSFCCLCDSHFETNGILEKENCYFYKKRDKHI